MQPILPLLIFFINHTFSVRAKLLILTEKFRRNSGNGQVEIMLSREDLASMVGTATETLVRLLQELKKEEIIEINVRAITVKKIKELVVMSKFF